MVNYIVISCSIIITYLITTAHSSHIEFKTMPRSIMTINPILTRDIQPLDGIYRPPRFSDFTAWISTGPLLGRFLFRRFPSEQNRVLSFVDRHQIFELRSPPRRSLHAAAAA